MSLSSMDAGAVDLGLACAWYGPEGPMISNEDVKKLCEVEHGTGGAVGATQGQRWNIYLAGFRDQLDRRPRKYFLKK